MAVVNEIYEAQSELERDLTHAYAEITRLKGEFHRIIAITRPYEGPTLEMWDIEGIAIKAVLK